MVDFLSVGSVEQIRSAEEVAFAVTAPGELMHRASFALGVACADLLQETYGQVYGTTVVVVAGPGNNGGDALYAGAYLARRGVKVLAHCLVPTTFHGEGMQAFLAAGGQVRDCVGRDSGGVEFDLVECDLVVDGIAGLGSARPVDRAVANWINTQPVVVSVDIPSGVNADTGECDPDRCVHADLTVTFGALKPGLILMPGAEFAGEIEIVDIGLGEIAHPRAEVLTTPAAQHMWGDTELDAYKYSRGVVGIAAGSSRYPGAAQLCVLGAQYTGVGMVMFTEVGDFQSGITERFPQVVVGAHERITAWGVGPGFSGTPEEHAFLMGLLSGDAPVVLDAGALSALAQSPELRALVCARTATTVITPHAGEFRALFPDLGEINLQNVADAAQQLGAIVVGKGPRTVVCAPGGRTFIDMEGTAALATAGSGDVLTGNIAGQLAAHPHGDPVEVVALGVWMHGRAGRIAALDLHSPTALDIGQACALVMDSGELPA